MMLRMLSDRIMGFCVTRADVVAMPTKTPSTFIVCFLEQTTSVKPVGSHQGCLIMLRNFHTTLEI